MKGFIGSANIDTNSRLCMASSVAGHKRAFGSDTVPGCYEDLELADLVVLAGSNLAWCHPVLYQRLAAARAQRGTRVVVIDPRATATCDIADLHLPIAPGADVALFNGLLAHLSAAGHLDAQFVRRHTSGLEEALGIASERGLAEIAALTGLADRDIAQFYEEFAASERVVTVYSQGVNQSSAGTDKVNAILNCHLATGRIGRPGMGPFSVTGQPNAMGGREVGGLANMLAAHMEIADPRHRRIVQDFWRSPRIADRPGLKAVDLFRAVGEGRIKALWIMGTNPVVSLPEADRVREALTACPFVVVSDVVRHTDTTAHAHVLLPSAAWGEKDGSVTNSERRISRQRAFLDVPGEARPDWWQVCEVARRLGYGARFAYCGPAEIFAEYAALTGRDNAGSRDLDISAFQGLSAAEYAALAPFLWPAPAADRGGPSRAARPSRAGGAGRFFADGRFFTTDGRARLVPTPWRPPASAVSPRFPLVLNTGRIRDQWHTMTRTGKSPRLMAHVAEPCVEVARADAEMHGLEPGGIAEIESAHGRALLRVVVSDRQRPGAVFAPMHWTDRMASRARIDALVAASTDPVSGQPESKHTPVAVRHYPARWHAFAVTVHRPDPSDIPYFAIAPVRGGWRVELAGRDEPASWEDFARRLIGAGRDQADIELSAYADAGTGQHRFAAFATGRLAGLLFAARAPVSVAREWAAAQLSAEPPLAARQQLLAGRPGAGAKDRGAVVCACMDVGRNEIIDAARRGCASVKAIGEATGAGTNCGSCRSEIGRIVAETRSASAGQPVAPAAVA
jgi:assimilatory nitrate reductase catalytic subunit